MLVRLILLGFMAALLGAAAPPAPAQSAFERGEEALARNRLDEAAAAYREALATAPTWAPALNGLGTVFFRQGRLSEAIGQFRAAVAADPGFKLAWFNLGYAARKDGDFATAAQAYEQFTQLAPDDADGFYGLGESYRQLGQPGKAITAYEAYIAREKRPSEQQWVEKAREHITALRSQLSAEQARPDAQDELAALPAGALPPWGGAHPALSVARMRDGDALMKERRYREATFAYLDATHANPGNVEALFRLGNAFEVLGYYAQAIERWNRVAQLTPDTTVRQSALDNAAKAQARVAQQGGSPQAQGLPPGSGPVAETVRAQARRAYEQGVQRIHAKDYSGALQSLTQALQSVPTLAVAYTARGSAYIGLRRYAEAVVDYEYALRLAPDTASPLYGLGEAYRMLGRNVEARTHYERYAASTARDVRPDLQSDARRRADQLR